MAERAKAISREDEYEVDFINDSKFAAQRYSDIVESIKDDLLQNDLKVIDEKRDCESLQAAIARKRDDPKTTAVTRRLVNQIRDLPRSIDDLVVQFEKAIEPEKVSIHILWGLLYLVITLSLASVERLKPTVEWMSRLRREVEKFKKCLEMSSEANEKNEARIATVDVFDPMFAALSVSIKYQRDCPTDDDLEENRLTFDTQMAENLDKIKHTVEHMKEITNFSSTYRGRAKQSMQQRHALVTEADGESYPMEMLPFKENPNFFGRADELEAINEALKPKKEPTLRTYTIYGRRGVGKTELAMKYCLQSLQAETFDAIFWIRCETALALRHSFTEMAIKIDPTRAAKHGRDEENQMAVLKWLKETPHTWLLVFDNAEKEMLLRGYFPKGVNGAILLTSRKYYNFLKDHDRKGDTVKLFSDDESFDLLCTFLGPSWKSLRDENKMKEPEVKAARSLLKRLTGLALAIQQASVLIKNENIGGGTIESTFELFEKHAHDLPERQIGKERSDTYHALEALWDMNFTQLDGNSRQLLAVLSLLSPDTTYVDLFLPRQQKALSTKLEFCRQQPGHIDEQSITLTSVVQPTPALENALRSLIKAGLIRQDGRVITVHREVQEAMNFHSVDELQEYFDTAVSLVHEAFPKRRYGISLFEQWSICSEYIHDAVHLVMKFRECNAEQYSQKIQGTTEFVTLIGNAAWYLYEVGDYDGALEIIGIGYTACVRDMRESLLYADLCNTAGAALYEKNDLIRGRAVYDNSFRIRSKKLPHDHIDMAAILHNRGNLESADGNFEKAAEYFNRVFDIRSQQGETGANQLALLYLCIGRNNFWQAEREKDKAEKNHRYEEAERSYRKAETLLARTIGPDKHFMSHVNYAYGNLEYGRGNYAGAKRLYEECNKIATVETPIHPITCAAYYSLGCCEFKLRRYERARNQLEKAKSIAELRSPHRDDGTVTRIVWMLAQVLQEDPLQAAQAEILRTRAQDARRDLTAKGESTTANTFDDEGNFEDPDDETLYDCLVPGFFR